MVNMITLQFVRNKVIAVQMIFLNLQRYINIHLFF